jgi:hypothetical protein
MSRLNFRKWASNEKARRDAGLVHILQVHFAILYAPAFISNPRTRLFPWPAGYPASRAISATFFPDLYRRMIRARFNVFGYAFMLPPDDETEGDREEMSTRKKYPTLVLVAKVFVGLRGEEKATIITLTGEVSGSESPRKE